MTNYDYDEEGPIRAEKRGGIPRPIMAIIGGLLGAAVGAVLWAGVGIVTEYETRFVALIVGLLAGGGVLLLTGGRGGIIGRLIAALAALLAIGVGKYALMYWFLTQEVGAELMASRGLTPFSPEIMELFPQFLQDTLEGLDIVFVLTAAVVAFFVAARSGQQEETPKADDTAAFGG